MEWRVCSTNDLGKLAQLNRYLREDGGFEPMELRVFEDRLRRWMEAGYTAVIFEKNDESVAYALFRPTDLDMEGLEPGIFIRQFFVMRNKRREGIGRQAFETLRDQLWPKGCGILLETEYENHRAQAFWKSLGFSEYAIGFIREPSAI